MSLMRNSMCLLLLTLFSIIYGQVTFTKIPKKLQCFGRNLTTDSGTVVINGTVKKAGANYQEMRLKIYRETVLQTTFTKALQFSPDTATFSFSVGIFAGLANYRYAVYGYNGSVETLVASADSVVCGDIFIVTGQSNSVAWNLAGTSANSANSNQSPFIRVFGSGCYNGSDSIWRMAQGDGTECSSANAGQWGLHLARLILDNKKIPVAIFNGGHGGMPIQFFQRNDANPVDKNTNYGRLLMRVRGAGLDQNIRAIIWHQGENNTDADANWLSLAGYKSAFVSLSTDWLADYPNVEKIYVFQISNGCGHPADSVARIKEAHRELAQLAKVSVMSTSAQNHYSDNCHYPYDNGYKSFAENIYRLMLRDLYGGPITDNINAPNVKFAELSANGLMINLIMEDIMDSLTWATVAEADFKFQGTNATVSKGTCIGYTARLTMNTAANGVTTVSYLGHQNTPEPMVTNSNGIGALHFYKYPITTPRFRDSVCLAAILKSNSITLPFDSVAVFNADKRLIALKLAKRKITTLPREIGYLDSLKTIDISGNLLSSLPREIMKTSPSGGLLLGYNYLCTVSDSLTTWITKYSGNSTWKTTQLLDSSHYCNGTVAVIDFSSEAPGLAASGSGFFYRLDKNNLTVRFPASFGDVNQISLLGMNGAVVTKITKVVPGQNLTINMSGHSKGMYLLQVISGSQKIVRKIAVF